MSLLHSLDANLAAMKSKHPGWRIWYVPTVTSGVRWCAVRLPSLETDSPEHLSQEIEFAEGDHVAGILPGS
jgi:hypothetical protein